MPQKIKFIKIVKTMSPYHSCEKCKHLSEIFDYTQTTFSERCYFKHYILQFVGVEGDERSLTPKRVREWEMNPEGHKKDLRWFLDNNSMPIISIDKFLVSRQIPCPDYIELKDIKKGKNLTKI